jgi:hypothetical protein
MDTEGMQPHPIFEALKVVSDSLSQSVYAHSFGQLVHHDPTGPSVGWDRAFEDLEDDDRAEQAWAFSLGFVDASEYHAATRWCDRTMLMIDWYEREDLRP